MRLRLGLMSLLMILLWGCAATPETTTDYSSSQFPFSFTRPPYIHPKIVEDLSCWLSDGGDQVVMIDLLESNKSNRYFGEVEVQTIPGEPPYVYVDKPNESGQAESSFGYQYVGATKSGIHVLLTESWGGGSGIFRHLMLVRFERDRGISCDWGKLSITADRNRLLIRKLGEIALGDRWDGELRIDGDKLFVGADHGWFTVSGGTGGGPLSYDRRDRILEINLR